MLTQKQILKNIQHNTNKTAEEGGGGGSTSSDIVFIDLNIADAIPVDGQRGFTMEYFMNAAGATTEEEAIAALYGPKLKVARVVLPAGDVVPFDIYVQIPMCFELDGFGGYVTVVSYANEQREQLTMGIEPYLSNDEEYVIVTTEAGRGVHNTPTTNFISEYFRNKNNNNR